MGCVIRTDAPQDLKTFTPEWSYLPMYQEKENRYREDQKQNYDRHHRTRSLPELPNDTSVWVSTPQGQIPGKSLYLHQSQLQGHIMLNYVPSGQVRRNRSHLRIRATPSELEAAATDDRDCRITHTRSQTGTQI